MGSEDLLRVLKKPSDRADQEIPALLRGKPSGRVLAVQWFNKELSSLIDFKEVNS
jgi:hypothetical protein